MGAKNILDYALQKWKQVNSIHNLLNIKIRKGTEN